MKKIQKVSAKKAKSAPAWFAPAMEKAMERIKHKIDHAVPIWFAPAMERAMALLATKEEMRTEISLLARKDEMASSFHAIIDMLDERATKDDLRKLTIRVDRTLATLSNHEARIIHLEGTLPSQ
ncbi:MAG: hypothetical protein NTX63_00245 [Candidatus Peregrinibacteria bacterium]|nr:hypothetical protein [Candidatus Peregrinibacteria bacterium]